MADLIIIRLYPKKPVTGPEFTNSLTGLSITVSEMSVTDPKAKTPGQVIGSAFYNPLDPASRVVQHLMPPLFTTFAAAATAVIDVGAFEPPAYKEYPSTLPFVAGSDLRLSIKRGAQTIVDTSLNYNVAIEPGVIPLPGNDPGAPLQYVGFTEVALYLALPDAGAGIGPGEAWVDVPTDGSPPNYDQLLAAVQTVLNADPGAGLYDIKKLTADQCRHVAYEILWNRAVNPLPLRAPGAIEQYYTMPGASPGHDTDRKQFESDLVTYYTTNNTQADTLAKYVYALSAALACQQKTVDAKKAGFSLPILPGTGGTSGKVADTDVILSS